MNSTKDIKKLDLNDINSKINVTYTICPAVKYNFDIIKNRKRGFTIP